MNNIWTWILIAIAIIGGGYWLWSSNGMSSPMPATSSSSETQTPQSPPSVETTPTATSATSPTPASTQGSPAAAPAPVPEAPSVPMKVTITYNGDGFDPQQVTIAKGGTVTWRNTSGGKMWVASAPHPAHAGYDSTDRATHCAEGYSGPAPFDQCGKSGDFSFTFGKTGTWPFHDHLNAQLFGKVVVQ